MKTYKFPQGEMPAIGLGTWKMDNGSATAAVKSALELGYRHIDCAPIYQNEPAVGAAFADVFNAGEISREDVWITSKLWCNRHRPDLVEGALRQTLADLRLDYLNLFMIHWPIVFRHDVHRPETASEFVSLEELPLTETWQALEACVDAGLCKNIGVCNFSIKKLKTILADCRIKPAANQVECHPYFPQNELFDFCQLEGIQPVAYSPLGSGDRPERMRAEDDPSLFESPVLQEIAAENGVTAGQVMLAWACQRGTVAIPKSSSPTRQTENLLAAELELSGEQMEKINHITTNRRYVHGRFWEMEGSPYTVANLWDE
ncbi:MAG: alcohol dehydrogenase (NADP+) [Mariniblastus sp.]|jgi:alcohol dehydrogenase (NADP+)